MRPLICALLAVIASAAAGCRDGSVLRVGAKAFAEQKVLGEVLRRLLISHDLPTAPVVGCGDTFTCHQALGSGAVDILVEYSGTALLYSGAPVRDLDTSPERLRARYRPRGLRWMVPLGFDNGYRVVVSAERAQAHGIKTIADLARIGDLRIVCPRTYLRRPRDGLTSLMSRHGLRTRAKPRLEDDPALRLQALFDGRADAAIVYATDGALVGRNVLMLGDSLKFFPPYAATLMVREAVLSSHPTLEKTLSLLRGRISTSAMLRLNYAASVEGRRAIDIAYAFLAKHKLQGRKLPKRRRMPDLVIAAARADDLHEWRARAIAAGRVAWRGRAVKLLELRRPLRALRQGKARLAIVGAERLFARDPRDNRLRREPGVEAVAVVGSRLVHVLRRGGDSGAGLAGRVGAQPPDSGAGRVADELLASYKRAATLHADAKTLVARLREEKLDAVILVAVSGARVIDKAIAGGAVRVRALEVSPSHELPPFLRRARIAPNTYAGQGTAVETLRSQVVFAAARPVRRRGISRGGLGNALSGPTRALSAKRVEALTRAARVNEVPDPALPSAWNRGATAVAQVKRHAWLDIAFNALVIGFIVWVLALLFRRQPERTP